MHGILDRARREPKRVVSPDGEHEKIVRAAKILVDEGIARPVLLGMAKPVHVLQRGVEVEDIVNMAAIYVVDAQEVDEPDRQTDLPL